MCSFTIFYGALAFSIESVHTHTHTNTINFRAHFEAAAPLYFILLFDFRFIQDFWTADSFLIELNSNRNRVYKMPAKNGQAREGENEIHTLGSSHITQSDCWLASTVFVRLTLLFQM